ncbi:hypothetical protein C2S51_020848 [Perilla frutescens var. frutescens]|nr:hypothetical protein C2S51_020848 [Perilla frutescens var. frutescens]
MAGMIKPISTILVAAVLVAALTPLGEAKITCGKVMARVGSCLPYVTDIGPIGKCCDGVKSLQTAAKTMSDRQSVCRCLKTMAASIAGINLNKAAGLPKECGVNIPYVISPDIDCSKVK